MTKLIIEEDGSYIFDVCEDFKYPSDETTDIEIPQEVLKDWMEANPSRSLSEFGDDFVEAVKDYLRNE